MNEQQEIYLSAKYSPDGRVYEMSATVAVPSEAATEMFLTMAARALARAVDRPKPQPTTDSSSRVGSITRVDTRPAVPDPLSADTKVEDLWAAQKSR